MAERQLTTLELCAGYNGLGMAVEHVFNARITAFSEFAAAPSKILAYHYPDIPNLGDMTRIDWAAIEPPDIISGGTPCQDLSHAGRRAGMTEGTRSNLWVQMREAIHLHRPAWVVWENVRGAYSAKADSDMEHCPRCMGESAAAAARPVLRALGRVLGDLSDLGYDTQWRGVRAADVGACHPRFRVFVLARRVPGDPDVEDGQRGGPGRRGHASAEPGTRPDRSPGAGFAAFEDADVAVSGERRLAASGQTESGRARTDPGGRGGAPAALPEGVGRGEGRPEPARLQRGPGTALHGSEAAPDPAGARRPDTENPGAGSGGPDEGAWGVEPERDGSERPPADPAGEPGIPRQGQRAAAGEAAGTGQAGLPGGHRLPPSGGTDWGKYGPAIARWENITGRPAPNPTEPNARGGQRLSPHFTEWMMGLPAGWVTDPAIGISRSAQLKACGDGVVPQQAIAALEHMLNAHLRTTPA